MTLENQRNLKKYLELFYNAIFRIRLNIEVHKTIGDAIKEDGTLNHQYWWSFLQTHQNVNAAVSTIFSVLDNRNNSEFKKFCKFLKKNSISDITITDLDTWLSRVESYKALRDERIAHININPSRVPDVNYQIFLDILSEFEVKLRAIENQYIVDKSLKKDGMLCEGSGQYIEKYAVIKDLKLLLKNN